MAVRRGKGTRAGVIGRGRVAEIVTSYWLLKRQSMLVVVLLACENLRNLGSSCILPSILQPAHDTPHRSSPGQSKRLARSEVAIVVSRIADSVDGL